MHVHGLHRGGCRFRLRGDLRGLVGGDGTVVDLVGGGFCNRYRLGLLCGVYGHGLRRQNEGLAVRLGGRDRLGGLNDLDGLDGRSVVARCGACWRFWGLLAHDALLAWPSRAS